MVLKFCYHLAGVYPNQRGAVQRAGGGEDARRGGGGDPLQGELGVHQRLDAGAGEG